MEFKKIVLIFNTPALNTDIQTYSLEELLDLEYRVCILDASSFLLPEANRIVTAKRFSDKRFESYICKTKKELEYHIRQDYKSACFIPMFNSYYDVRFVFKLFTKYKVFYGHVTTARTELELTNGVKAKRVWKESRLNPFHLYKAVYNRIVSKIIKYQRAKFLVFGGKANEALYINQIFHGSGTKIIRLHSFDYERFLFSPKYNYNGKPYCVYLDQYFPFHPDIKTQLGFNFTDADKKKFVDDMNKIFEHIRNKYNMDIIIAAHPRSDYNEKKDMYPNTIIEYGMTSQLIKGASLVVANFSNSIFFAVMAHLPLIIVNSSVIKKVHRLEIGLQGFAELTGAPVVESASELPDKFEIPVNKEKYVSLEKSYFKSGESNGKSMWECIFENI